MPAFTISFVGIFTMLATIALGGVDTGIRKDKLQLRHAGIIR